MKWTRRRQKKIMKLSSACQTQYTDGAGHVHWCTREKGHEKVGDLQALLCYDSYYAWNYPGDN